MNNEFLVEGGFFFLKEEKLVADERQMSQKNH